MTTITTFEFIIQRIIHHKPITCVGVKVRKEARRMTQAVDIKTDQPCKIDTAEEYKHWLETNDALLKDPE